METMWVCDSEHCTVKLGKQPKSMDNCFSVNRPSTVDFTTEGLVKYVGCCFYHRFPPWHPFPSLLYTYATHGICSYYCITSMTYNPGRLTQHPGTGVVETSSPQMYAQIPLLPSAQLWSNYNVLPDTYIIIVGAYNSDQSIFCKVILHW